MADAAPGPIDYLGVRAARQACNGRRVSADDGSGRSRASSARLDILFIGKDADGNVSKVGVAEVAHSDAPRWSGCGACRRACLTNRISIRSRRRSSRAALRGSGDENVWAAPMWTAIDSSSARLVGAGRILRPAT